MKEKQFEKTAPQREPNSSPNNVPGVLMPVHIYNDSANQYCITYL